MLALVQARSLEAGSIAALTALGCVALGALLVFERRTEEPMLPLALWRRRVVALCNAAGVGGSAALMALPALLPIFRHGEMGCRPTLARILIEAHFVSLVLA